MSDEKDFTIENQALAAAVALLPEGTEAVLIACHCKGETGALWIVSNVSPNDGAALVMQALNEAWGTQRLLDTVKSIAESVWEGPRPEETGAKR